MTAPIWSKEMRAKRWHWTLRKKGPSKIEGRLLTTLTEALFGAKNKSCTIAASAGKTGWFETKSGFWHQARPLPPPPPPQLSGEQFVSLREFKGDQCQVPSPPLNDDQYVSDVQFDRNPCPHLVNALSVAQVITGRAQCVSCGLTWTLGGAVFVLKWGGVLVEEISMLVAARTQTAWHR